ncbi:Ku80 [Apiospora hydei]|uniref:DNA helicase n=1 Tax=Apiospora hydei TaxID=1337664 RepID=A0ABR1WXZ7_9PEZI
MADKEATVYIVDLGSSMADCHNGRIESDMSWSMQYVWDRISTTVAANRKTWNIGVVGLKTDETDNPLAEEDGYNNISVLRELGPMGMAGLRSLQEKIQPSSTDVGDCLSAIVIAMEMIQTFTKKLKYNRRIFLVTNGESPLDEDEEAVTEIAARIKELGIELTVLWFGFKEEDKTEQKTANEVSLKKLTDACDGQFGTIAEAIAELSVPRLKPVKPYKSYEGPLTLGDPQQGAMIIEVERYFKAHKATIPPASNVVLQQNHATQAGDGGAMEGVQSTGGDFAAVSNVRTYKVNDPREPLGKLEVKLEDLAKGYEYGRTAVHISDTEHNITKIETTKGFAIIGFIPQDNFEPFVNMGDSCMIVPQKFNDEAAIKLSSFIHSLHELESYAIARLVMKDGKEPLLLILAPHIDLEFECLYDILNTSDSEDAVKDAAKQMGQIVRDLISDSMGDLSYERVIEDLGVLREGMVDFEFAALFNSFLLDLKKKILSGELGVTGVSCGGC